VIAGTLEIQLLANMARLQQDMDQAKRVVGNAMDGIERAAASAKAALGGIAAGLVLTAITDKTFGAIKSLADLSDMAQKTGASVENLSKILKVASATGFDASAIDAGLVKLSKGMATVDNDTNKVNQALKALGLSATDSAGKMRDPAQVYIDIATKLSTFKDSANKTAIAIDLMGKSGAQQLPFFNDMVEHLGKFSATSTEAAKQAERLSEAFGVMKTKSGEAFTAFAIDLMPTFERISTAFSESSKGASSFALAAKAISVVLETLVILGSEVAYVFRAMGTEIGGIAAQMAALAKLDFAGFKAIGKAMKEDAAAARLEHDKFIQSVMNGKKVIAESAPTKSLDYLSGKEKKEVAEKISDYQKLTQEIAKLTAEQQKRLELGRALTTSEKRLADLIADRATGAKKLTGHEFELAKAQLAGLDAVEKQVIAAEKLKKAREEIAQIVTNAEAADKEYIARLELENSLVGKSVLQQSLLRAEFEANLTLKRQYADIDKAAKGTIDPAAIEKLKAESAVRIQAIKDVAKAKIDADYITKVNSTLQAHKNPEMTQLMGARLMPEEVARQTAAAHAEHAIALAKINDLDVIRGKIEIEAKLKADIARATAEAQDMELVRATGADILATEAAEKIAKYGADNVEFEAAALAMSRDKALIEAKGFEERNKQLAARVQFFTAEAEAAKEKLGMSANQLAFDNANLKLQQDLLDIQKFAGDADEQRRLGLAKQIELQGELIGFLAKKRNLDMSQVGSGEELVKINEELLRLKTAIDGLDTGAAAKADLAAKAAQKQLDAAKLLADTTKKTINTNMVTQFESDFHAGMLRLMEFGNTSWNAMIKSWKNSFKVNVVDYIYKEFAKPFVFKAIMSIAGVLGANGLAAAAGTEADKSPLFGGHSSTTDWMTIGKALWDGMSNGFTAFGKMVETGLSKAGMSAANAGAAGTAASYLGAGLAGVTIGTFIAGDKTLLGMNGMTTSVLGSALMWALAPALGPLGLFIGGVAGGALNFLFGSGPKVSGESTVAGSFSGAGFEGAINTPWTQKNGVLRRNGHGTDVTPLSDPAQQLLNGMIGQSATSFARLITLSGDAARSVDGWNFAINRALTNEEDITKLFGEMADSMGTFVIPELEKFRAKGENLADTAVRMGDEYIITDSIFKMLGFTTAETGIASLGMRDSLIQLMGGIQATSATMDSYYKNFYTAEEQHANSLRQVNDAFKVLGVTAPTTRDEFRKLAETLIQDTTPAGQALFASAMKLNPAFAAVTQSTEELAAAAKDAMASIGSALDRLRGTGSASLLQAQLAQDTAMVALTAAAPWILTMEQLQTITMEDAGNYSTANKLLIAGALGAAASLKELKDRIRADALANAQKAVTDAFSTVQKTVQAERDLITKAYQDSLDKVNKSVTVVTASIDKLKSLSNALKQAVAGIMPPSRAEAQAQIMTALAIARAGGGLPTAESLAGALQSISEPSQKLFSTFVEWQTDQKITANNIAALAGMSDEQITVQDKQLGVLEATRQVLEGTQAETMKRLDGILTRGQKQIDQMTGIDTSVISVATAVNYMAETLNNYLRVKNNEPGFVGNESAGSGTGPGGTYTFEDQARDRYGAGATTGAGRGGVASSGGMGGDSTAFNIAWSLLNHVPYNSRANQDALAQYYRELTASKPVQYRIPPGFANGGIFGGGYRVVGENGPELEYTGQSRIHSNADSKKLLNNDDVVAVVRELIATVKAGDIAIAKNTGESARLAKRWDGQGLLVRAESAAPLLVRETPA
jgi:hypothetical protein